MLSRTSHMSRPLHHRVRELTRKLDVRGLRLRRATIRSQLCNHPQAPGTPTRGLPDHREGMPDRRNFHAGTGPDEVAIALHANRSFTRDSNAGDIVTADQFPAAGLTLLTDRL